MKNVLHAQAALYTYMANTQEGDEEKALAELLEGLMQLAHEDEYPDFRSCCLKAAKAFDEHKR